MGLVGSPTFTFFLRPPAHLHVCAVTYITEISFNVTLSNQFNKFNSYNYNVHVLNYKGVIISRLIPMPN